MVGETVLNSGTLYTFTFTNIDSRSQVYIFIHEQNRSHATSLNTCTLKFIDIQDYSIQQFLFLFSNSCPSNNFISVHHFLSIQRCQFIHEVLYSFNDVKSCSKFLYPFNDVNSFTKFLRSVQRCQLFLEIVTFIQELLRSNCCTFRDAISVGSQSPRNGRRVFQPLSSTGSNSYCFQQHVIFWMNMNVCGVQAVSI